MKKETIATYYGYDQKTGVGSMAVPIYLTTVFDFGTSEMTADRFCLKNLGPIFSRLTNSTVNVLEKNQKQI